jgi:Flp pilus assembly protein TadD
VRNDLGLALRQSGAVERAIHELRLCLQLKPQYAAAHYNLALALQDAGQAESAAELRIVRKLDPMLPAQ